MWNKIMGVLKDVPDHGHRHDGTLHEHTLGHGHRHGTIDPGIVATTRGIRAVKWSFAGLIVTAIFQGVVVWLSGSVALLTDTIHNAADAATAMPLWIAFTLAHRKPNKTFTYGYGRAEDLAGMSIVIVIALSAAFAAYEAVQRLLHPQPVGYLWAVAVASIVGFIGNEAVAIYRIKVGKEINSAALVADGYHARMDGLTSLAVLVGAIGVWLGFPLADPIIGLLITFAIARIVWQSGQTVFTRALDGIEPGIIDAIHHTASQTEGVKQVGSVRARWLGHRLHTEIHVVVAAHLSAMQAHTLTQEVRHALLHRFAYLSSVIVQVEPSGGLGESSHPSTEHGHAVSPVHSH